MAACPSKWLRVEAIFVAGLIDPGGSGRDIGVGYLPQGAVPGRNQWGLFIKTIFASCKAPVIYLGYSTFDERNGDFYS